MRSKHISWLQGTCAAALLIGLAACGGGGGGDSASSNTSTGTSTDKPTTAKTPTISVKASPDALTLGDGSNSELLVTNPADTTQTVSFDLAWPAGAISSKSVSFSAPCVTSMFSTGGTSIKATLNVPAKTSCSWAFTKTFNNAGSGQAVTTVSLSNLALDGNLPTFSVTDPRTQYVGLWRDTCQVDGVGGASLDSTISMALSGSNRVAITETEYSYAGNTCGGTGTQTDSFSYFLEFDGTTTIAPWGQVDKTKVLDLNGLLLNRAVNTVRDNKVYITASDDGDDLGTPVALDSEGYPKTLDAANFITRITN